MKRKQKIIYIAIVFVLSLTSFIHADSIWSKRNKNLKDLYADDKARHIGDILTILITEDSTVDNKLKRTLQKTTARESVFDGNIDIKYPALEKILPEPLLPSLTFTATSDNKFDGKSNYKDERSFIDAITVTVVDIMPNNNLVVMGVRERNIANDKQIIEISGIVRPSDISFDNTIESKRVADFTVLTRSEGISDTYLKPGWLGSIMDWLWPF